MQLKLVYTDTIVLDRNWTFTIVINKVNLINILGYKKSEKVWVALNSGLSVTPLNMTIFVHYKMY